MQFKNFDEASRSNRPFYQISFYDRRKEYSGVLEHLYFSTKKETENAIAKMKKCNEDLNKDLFERMLKIYKSFGVTRENYMENGVWNRLVGNKEVSLLSKEDKALFRFEKNKVGFCHIRWSRRDLKQEEREEQEEMSKLIVEEGPYGGAFKDWNDFYRWKER